MDGNGKWNLRKQIFFLSLTLALFCHNGASAYRPVILMHGIMSNARNMDPVAEHIKENYPGTSILNVNLFEDFESLFPLADQVEKVTQLVKPFMEQAMDGVNMICYSQGTLICRAILEQVEDHNVHTYVSISGPQAGQFGDTDYLNFFFPNFAKEHIYEVFYTDLGEEISVANYWKDPHHLELYKKYCHFLNSLNGPSEEHKKNFLRIKKAVFIGGPDDGVITPWQSSHFGFYDTNEDIVEFKEQEVFTEDTFGLRTLYEAGNMTVCIVPGIYHTEWPKSLEVYKQCINPWLS